MLDLSNSYFSDLRLLADCTKISELNVNGTAVDLATLPDLPLQILEATSCKCSDNAKRLESLGETLVWLNLSRIKGVEEWSFLAKMTALEYLNLSNTKIKDLSHLLNCKNLRELVLDDCSELIDLQPIANLSSLKTVKLQGLPDKVDTSPLDQDPCLEVLK